MTDRSQVLVLGDHPVDEVPFEQRHMTLRRVALKQLDDLAITGASCGVLLAASPRKPKIIASYFASYFDRACDCGLATLFKINNKSDRDQACAFRKAAFDQAKLFVDVADPIKREEQLQSLPWIQIKDQDW